MNATEHWVTKFTEQLNCVSCRKYKPVKLYYTDGTPVPYEVLPISEIENNLEKMDVWCDDCQVRPIFRVKTQGRIRHKQEAAEIAKLSKKPWHDSASRLHILDKGVFVAKSRFVEVAKEKPCTVCGQQYHHSAMEFHKLNMKPESIRKITLNSSSVDLLIEEMERCSLVCANCHRMLHSKHIKETPPVWNYDEDRERILNRLSN